MAQVFISYSRRDDDFVRRLNNELAKRDREVWIDWEDIPRGTDWLNEIYAGIEGADTFLIIVSQHSLTSEICNYEIAHARKFNKRIIPIIRQRIEGDLEKIVKGTWVDQQWEPIARANWDAVRHINWLLFDDDTRFGSEFAVLLKTLDEDLAHTRAHTAYLVRALNWERGARNPSFLLKRDEITFAEKWLADSVGKHPQPDPLHRDYIAESRRTEDEQQAAEFRREQQIRRLRRASASLMATMVIVLFVALSIGFLLNSRAIDAEGRAATATIVQGRALAAQETSVARESNANTRVAVVGSTLSPVPVTLTAVAQKVELGENRIESLRLAAEANAILDQENGNPEIAVLLGIRALNIAYSPQAETALTQSLDRTARRVFSGQQSWISSITFSLDGQYILSGSHDSTARLWDAQTGGELGQFIGYEPIESVAFSPDGRTFATGEHNGAVNIWDFTKTEQPRISMHADNGFDVIGLAFSPDGQMLATGTTDGIVQLWDTTTGEARHTIRQNPASAVTSVALSPDGRFILTGSDDSTAQLWDIETGESIFSFNTQGGVTSVAFSPDGLFALTGSIDGAVQVWELRTGNEYRVFNSRASTGSVKNVAFSHDGQQVIAGSEQAVIMRWDIATGTELPAFSVVGPFGVASMTFSPDTRSVIVGSEDGTMRLWDIPSPEELFTVTNHTGRAVFSPDGQQVLTIDCDTNGTSSCGRASARLWNAVTGQPLNIFADHTSSVRTAAFSLDGRSVLTGSADGTVRLWNAATGTELQTFTSTRGAVLSVAFSPDGQTIITKDTEGVARLWDVNTGEETRAFGNPGMVTSVAVHPHGHLALTGSVDGTARLWDIASGTEIHQFNRHVDMIWSVAFSADGIYALTGSADGTARLWETLSGTEVRQFDHASAVLSVAFGPEGSSVLTGSTDHVARLWDAQTGQLLQTFTGHTDVIGSVAFSPDGSLVLTGAGQFQGDDTTARLWSAQTGKVLRIFDSHSAWVRSVAFSPDGLYVLTGGCDNQHHICLEGSARLWNAVTGEPVSTFSEDLRSVEKVAFSPDGKHLLTTGCDEVMNPGLGLDCSSGETRIWSIKTGEQLAEFTGTTAAFSIDGRQVLTGSRGGLVQLWDIDTRQEAKIFTGNIAAVSDLTFSPDGRALLTGHTDGVVRLWNAQTWEAIRQLDLETSVANSVAFSPDGQQILTGDGNGLVQVWRIDTGSEIHRLSAHNWSVNSVAFSPDGRYLLTLGCEQTSNGDCILKTLRLWDAQSGTAVRQFAGHGGSITSAAFSPDGQYVLTSADGTVRLWNTEYQDFIATACQRNIQDFTPEQRRQYGISTSEETCVRF